jgi:hypothetical protein
VEGFVVSAAHGFTTGKKWVRDFVSACVILMFLLSPGSNSRYLTLTASDGHCNIFTRRCLLDELLHAALSREEEAVAVGERREE